MAGEGQVRASHFARLAARLVADAALPRDDSVIAREDGGRRHRKRRRQPPDVDIRRIEAGAEAHERLDRACRRQAKGTDERDDMANVLGAVISHVAAKQTAEADADQADRPALQRAELPQPQPQAVLRSWRRPPIHPQYPTEGAVAAALEESPQ